MMRTALRLALGMLLPAVLAAPAAAGTIRGHIRNGTTGKPVPRTEVVLISLVSGMEQLTSAQSDAEGAFSFDRPEIGQGPMLVRATYEGASYFQMAPPGRDTADIEVFEATAPATAVRLASRTLIFQPNGSRLMAVEDYLLRNSAQPSATYYNPKRAFEFEIPAGAKLGQVTATPPGGMPLPQGTTEKGKNRYAIDYPLKPGETTFRVAYDLPYEGNQAAIRAPSVVSADRVLLAAPAGMKIEAEGFAPGGTEQGYLLLGRENVLAGTPLAITLSGTAPVPTEQADAAQGGSNQGGRDGSAPAGENLQVMAPRLASFQWIVLGGMGVLFLLGFIYLMRQPATAAPPVAAASAIPAPPSGRAKKQRAGQPASQQFTAAAAQTAAPASSAVLEEVERGAQLNLEELKDKLFRLELRHQAGTISDEEYASERGRLQAVLRDLVRG